ncbi:Lovastatin diketide synthase LovF [Daldinia childiae]|uniref:Lovastatin diketide synthase LovF n=1 Tax=Daldinia childiae TaxID=326645 RepID=UPI0014469B29|nr:Lovastatin diketide synthase LovF [Daldinia childiae]KAF3064531.1 Lovastatin diketide synthase LovF [Daldinia childiae]
MQEQYNIPNDRIFYSRNLFFGRQIMQVTQGRGVDVVLNSLLGEALAESLRILAPLGRFVEIEKRDIHTFQNLPMQPFVRNVSYHAVNTKSVEHYNPAHMCELVLELVDMLDAGTFRPPRPTGRHIGKAVVDWETEVEIPVVPSPEPAFIFDANASYVIAGGLGGIGRSLAAWFSRRGANVATPRCDVSDANSLRAVIDYATKTLPPVKGYIQTSMVLKDRVFQNMTLDEWQTVLDLKINGTWNLHRILPKKMDFFVILSSTGGMDAFARHRWSLGERCVSVDVGVIKDVGYVAEHSDIAKHWDETKIQVLAEKDLLAVID